MGYLNLLWRDNRLTLPWLQLQLSCNKLIHVWGNNLSDPVLSACAIFLGLFSSLRGKHSWMLGLFKVHVLCLHFRRPRSALGGAACSSQCQTEGIDLARLFWLLQAGTMFISQLGLCRKHLHFQVSIESNSVSRVLAHLWELGYETCCWI